MSAQPIDDITRAFARLSAVTELDGLREYMRSHRGRIIDFDVLQDVSDRIHIIAGWFEASHLDRDICSVVPRSRTEMQVEETDQYDVEEFRRVLAAARSA
jgi:hypothetical protein